MSARKRMEKAYAQALWKLVEGGMDVKAAVHAIAAKLKRDGRESLVPRVGRAFERIAEREQRKHGFVLTIAREADEAQAKKEAKAYTSEFGIASQNEWADLKTQVDDSLIGGWRLEGNERLVDASYKQRLVDLFSGVTSA